MKSTVSLQVDTDILLQLIEQLRRPGDKQFKLACLLRREFAEQEKPAAPPTPAPQSDSVSQLLAALLSHAAAPASTTAKSVAEPPSEPLRDVTPGPGWDVPERRQFRYRLEDVAFD